MTEKGFDQADSRRTKGATMGYLGGIGLEFSEQMSGWIGQRETDFDAGRIAGERAGTNIIFDLKISIYDIERFLDISDHTARLTGTVTFEKLGGKFPIRDGVFNLFTLDPNTGVRKMIYCFRFTAPDGQTYFLHGYKEVKSDWGPFDLIPDMTTLFTKIHKGQDATGVLYGAGELFFKLRDLPSMMSSMTVTGNASIKQKFDVIKAFGYFALGILKEEYLHDINPLYDTEYENLILSGQLKLENGDLTPFFFVSGAHEKGFPWGDGESFGDIMLLIGDEKLGFKRYCISKRLLEGLRISVAHGSYSYQGPIFELTEGYATSFSEMSSAAANLVECQASFRIEFDGTKFDLPPFPFVLSEDLGQLADIWNKLEPAIREMLPIDRPLGIHIVPYTVAVKDGRLSINKGGSHTSYEIQIDKTFGEAEKSTFRNIKEPTLLYGYICGLQSEDKIARVQIHSNALRTQRQRWIKDHLEAFMGALISHIGSKEILLKDGKLKISNLALGQKDGGAGVPGFVKLGPPLIEVNNDHFPTANFQRRIIQVRDSEGKNCFALEEDMDLMRLEPINSGSRATVVAAKHDDSIAALDEVLERTEFFKILEDKFNKSGKSKDNFSIIIKPNFMFAYNKDDHTTYTDPKLVNHLVRVIKDEGFSNITVVEAQSTYGEYFDKRSVKEVAEYVGYDVTGNSGYKLVDLTLGKSEEQHLGPHLGSHPVPLTWRDADFRISFAKNKTHAYAFYTLTIKNIYGALPLPNKFKEYHCDRDIYYTTMEYLKAFPVDFGLVDAYVSADGPFGIFADSEPNPTHTIIGGANLVAVDWIAATKMGIDPMISDYMRLAVEAFGKPRINLIGDRSVYKPWLNVPVILTLFTHYGLDANYHFGYLFYMMGCYMDESHFNFKSKNDFILEGRKILKPLKEGIWLQVGGARSPLNVLIGRLEQLLGS
jgi:uncharacterized protein (DUF362 family)